MFLLKHTSPLKSAFLIWVLLTCFYGLHGREFRQLTKVDGLPHNRVQALAEDDLGNLWIGTSSGLVKYDGADCYPIEIQDGLSLAQTQISCLFYDRQKNLWIGTVEFGLYAINTHTGKTQSFFHETTHPGSLPDNRITGIFEDQNGQVWFGVHRKGICRLSDDGITFTGFRPSQQFPDLLPREVDVLLSHFADPFDSSRIWLGTLDGLFSMDNQTGEMEHFHFQAADFQHPENYNNLVNSIKTLYMDQPHELWMGTWGGGLCKLDLRSQRLESFLFQEKTPISQIRNVIRKISKGKNGSLRLLVTGGDEGIWTFDPVNHVFDVEFGSHFRETKALCVLEDSQENLWIGCSNGLHLKPGQKNPFQFSPMDYSVREVFPHPDGKRLFLAIQGQTLALEQDILTQKVKSYPYTPLLDKGGNINFVNKIHFTQDGQILMLENTDLYRLDSASSSLLPHYKFEVDEIRDNRWGFLDSELDQEGNLWLGNKYAGLFKLNLETEALDQFVHRPEDPQSLVHTAWVFDVMADDRGNLWLGTEEGWGYLPPGDTNFVNFPYNSLRSGKPGVQLKVISNIAQDSAGRIWVGSPHRGLATLMPDTQPDDPLTTFTQADGLRSDAIYDMCVSQGHHLWLITQAGLSQLDTRDFSIRNYGQEYGLEGLRRISVGPDGTLYISSRGGYYHFHPDDLQGIAPSPKVLLRSLQIFGNDFNGPQALNYLGGIDLDHDENFLSFEYAALDFFHAELVEYAYQMEGVDPDWVLAGPRRFCNYTDVKPGHHVFKVKARIEGQEWGAIKTLDIVIRWPFWQTWWFIGGSVLLFSLLVWLFVRWRLARIKAQFLEKKAFDEQLQAIKSKALQAQMNPHFLFNCLNSIKLLILKSEKEKAARYLSTFSKLIRLVLQNSEQQMINLADELQALELYISLEQLRLGDKFTYEIGLDRALQPEALQYPPLVLQPMVENAIWHGLSHKSEGGKLVINLRKVEQELVIDVIDNGVGRAASTALRRRKSGNPSFGIAITRERLRLAYMSAPASTASITIEDLFVPLTGEAAGTKVQLCTPLHAIS